MEARMSSYDTTDSTTDVTTHAGMDLWRVQLATGEVRVMTLDALDDAFQAGVITESSPVLPPGATAWTRLADAAGLETPSHESNVPSVAPMAVTVSESTGDATPYSAGRADFSLPDLDLDALEDEAFKPKRGRVFAVIGLAALFLGGVGFAASRMGNIASVAQSSLSAPPKAAAAAPPPAAANLDEAAPAKTLTEEQKAKLAEADKAREAAAAAREAQRRKDRPASPAKRGPREKTTTPFVNGGSKYDPLNGAL
jgi:hypothetical protein